MQEIRVSFFLFPFSSLSGIPGEQRWHCQADVGPAQRRRDARCEGCAVGAWRPCLFPQRGFTQRAGSSLAATQSALFVGPCAVTATSFRTRGDGPRRIWPWSSSIIGESDAPCADQGARPRHVISARSMESSAESLGEDPTSGGVLHWSFRRTTPSQIPTRCVVKKREQEYVMHNANHP